VDILVVIVEHLSKPTIIYSKMADPLPVPAQLEAQLSKCKTVRSADSYIKSRTKTAEVSTSTTRL
jgi:hypothetical protein